MGNRLFIVDVFAQQKYAGNQLAVVNVEKPISDDEMQHIAREMNFSETTFILSPIVDKGGYNVRIFTPQSEVPFAGHPTLGTAYIIWKEIIKAPVEKVVLNLKVGQIPVSFTYNNEQPEILTMKQNNPVFGKTFESEKIAQILQINSSDIDDRYPIEEVSTGLSFIITPLKNLDAVKKSKINKDKYNELINSNDSKAILIFSPQTYNSENQINVRMFADYYGVPEDPATGSANGCLAGYLVKNKYFGKDNIEVKSEQGYEINRKSLLLLKAEKLNNDKIDVYVGGKVIEIARGELV